YPLPEAQLDRFMFKLLVDYPSQEQEGQILDKYIKGHDHRRLDTYGLQAVLTGEQIIQIQRAIVNVIVEPTIVQYITGIVAKTRNWGVVEIGASPRASVSMLLASRALAACRGRNFVTPDDVKQLAPWVLRHRIRLNPEAEIEGTNVETVIQDILESVEAPQP
ncbi:MAG: magnesium chelatase, partial [Planctomycetales bacterium 12-60-4]